ncbi:MAG TPA: TlpA disulfide reductase family protein [Burkholderiaceae bacterium]|nr:TlpA disulfide reductase family protein [Burkholderiaceae bacterium]
MNRRKALFTGIALAAGAAGLGGALWRQRKATEKHDALEAAVWSRTFAQPNGQALRLADFRGKPLLLNFWATWCPPCVREMPLLDRFHLDQHANGWQVAGLAIDNQDAVKVFLAQHPVAYPIGLAGFAGAELARTLGNVGGGLPFTVIFDRSGDVVDRKLGLVKPAELAGWAATVD